MLNLKKNAWLLLAAFALIACDPDTDPVDPDTPDEAYQSYRYELWKNTLDAGWTIDYVGTQIDAGSYEQYVGESFDTDHEGIGGIESDGVKDNIQEVLSSIDEPDIVLLCVGGNDLLNGDDIDPVIENIEIIIGRIHQLNPNIKVFIEQIAPTHSNFMTNELDDILQQFNAKIAELGSSVISGGANIHVVDMFTDFTDDYFFDDVHYNEAGAKEVADRYFQTINEVLGAGTYKVLPLGDSRVEGAQP